jgi:hypothetical protein
MLEGAWRVPKPAFFVDGFTEMRVLQSICPTGVIRRLNMNGKDVKVSAIAKAVYMQYKLLGNKCYPIIVLIDREQRQATYEAIAQELCSEIEKLGMPLDQFHVGVCDRMIENWILADHELLLEKFGRVTHTADGEHGKGALRNLFTRDRPYQETVHGVELLLAASATRIAQRSASFASFVNQIPVQCAWLAG